MIPENRITTHPGTILRKAYLAPMKLTQKELADHLEIPVQRVNEIVRGKRGISPDTAWLHSDALNTSPEFWQIFKPCMTYPQIARINMLNP